MNFKLLYITLAILFLGFTACSNEESTENEEVEQQDTKTNAISASNTNIEGQVGENNTVKEEKEKVDPSQLAEIDFDNVTHDFGTVQEGEVVKYTFKFKNTGKKPLIIEKADPSCGCTASDFSKEPIPPGGEGYVKAEFNSANRPGVANKSIKVLANTDPAETILYIKGEVKGVSKMNGPFRNP